MTKRNQFPKRAGLGVGPFAAGVLIGASAVTPVFAATLDVERLQPLVLLGSLIVLLIGLALKAMAGRRSTKAEGRTTGASNSRDLRWREDMPAIDVALPTHELHELVRA